MKTIELFSGTKSFSKVMISKRHSILTIDNNKELHPDIVIDLLNKDRVDYICGIRNIDILWASPPCTGFSVASMGRHWGGGKCAYIPKSKTAEMGLQMLDNTIRVISQIKPKYWFIENPRAMMRIVIDKIFEKYTIKDYRRVTVTYCQYGDTRMKPTDIWTNIPDWQGKICKNGMSCHIAAPRGSKTGTQGLKNAKDRGVIPPALFEEILEYVK